VELQSKLDVALSALEDHNSNDSKSLSHATDAIERLSDALKHEEAKHMHDVQHLQRDIEAARHQIAQKSEESSQQVKKYGDLAFTLDNRTQELHRALEQCVALERAKMQIDDELEALRNKVVELQEQLQFSGILAIPF
jgi:chromosome segregation ATPase